MEESMDSFRSTCFDHLLAAFLAMEPTHCLISLAKESGGGSITEEVQRFIWEHCISNHAGKRNGPSHLYIKNFLRKVILSVESSSQDVLDVLYEQYAYYMTSFKDDSLVQGNSRVYKSISFLFPNGQHCPRPPKVVVTLQCSDNILEGDTGCSIWPSSLFLSEFILNYPEIFSNKFCFEVGSGVGLVGISLTYTNASRVIVSDGDLSSLANLKLNMELNLSRTGTKFSERTQDLVECKYLPWESASESELEGYCPDIILGADVIYDPLCVPHLVRVLAILLAQKKCNPCQGTEKCHNGILRSGCIINETSVADDCGSNFDQTGNFGHLTKTKYDDTDRATKATHQCESSRSSVSDKNCDENRIKCCSRPGEVSQRNASSGRSLSKVGRDGSVAYIATVIRNPDTFDCFLRLADQAGLSVVDITDIQKPLNLLPYMLSFHRSSIRFYAVYFM